jgi:hypothetical protein
MQIKFDDAAAKRIEEKVAKLGKVGQGKLFSAFSSGLLHIENEVKNNLTRGILNVRTGKLRQSIGGRVITKDGITTGYVSSGGHTGRPVIYANILEKGGTIKPKNKQWLTIPLEGSSALTPSGAQRFTARDIMDRSFIKGGVIYLKKGKRTIEPVFVLKKSVKIPAFKYLSLAAQSAGPRAQQYIEAAVDEIIKE